VILLSPGQKNGKEDNSLVNIGRHEKGHPKEGAPFHVKRILGGID